MTKVSQVAPLYNGDRQQDKAERREAVCNQVLDQIDTGFDQCMLMHGPHGFAAVGAGQNFNGHVVTGNGKDVLAGQPLRRFNAQIIEPEIADLIHSAAFKASAPV